MLSPADLGLPRGADLGERATVVQISSAFCAPCRAARTVAARVAASTDGVLYLDLDVAGNEALAAALQVATTPTVLVLDSRGQQRARLDGVPRLAWLRDVVSGL